MQHVRLVCPSHRTADVLAVLTDSPAVTNISVLRGAAVEPAGDLLLADVAREELSLVLAALRDLGLEHHGSITVQDVDASLSDVARRAETAAPGAPEDAVVWEEVEARASDDSQLSVSYLLFFVVAASLGAIALLTDSLLLLVGCMIVGPDFGPLAGLCVGLVRRQWVGARHSAVALTVGFVASIAAAAALTAVLRMADAVPGAYSNRTLTSFVSRPDGWSLVVALLAGLAGTLSLTSAKSGALIGVLISVTTVPASADVGVTLVLGKAHELGGAAGQLGLNLAGLIMAGVVTLSLQRTVYRRRRRAEQAGTLVGRKAGRSIGARRRSRTS